MTDPGSGPLSGTGVTVREAGPGDTVGGVPARWVALPETVEEIAAVLRACAAHDLAAVPVGGGTKLHWGPPPERCDVLLDLCCMNEVLEHAAGDLVVRVQAGVTMEALAGVLAAEGQELALDVPFAEGATVGGTLAAALPGPRAFRYGAARDLLIGITVVLADGTIARSGGKVVKNVAGYDLGKLFTGSYGTLGVIAEATFRLHPLPGERCWVVAEVPADDVPGIAAALAASQAEPSAVEVDRPEPGGPVTLAALVEGTAAGKRAEALRDLAGAGTVTSVPPPWWGLVPANELLVEVRFPPAACGAVLAAASGCGLSLRGSAVAGRVSLEPWEPVGEAALPALVTGLRERVEAAGGRVNVVATPYAGVDRWGRVSSLPLMRRVKERFDPGRRMSPGRLTGGV
ncbi:FAD-linked oxidase [Nonomuraea sp. WAC 01424]|uniref:FAD-binding oxidoreductase n=1 Tax=Nonomuraea sp. WAC 01424 TaxID=2203200 RepID=UPI000F76DDA6|nr:FAD-binding oxidoreductase [Nonomuraea sp. WAC 01424]RSN12876.1 FAD-linked oxidase [Nonomuraea sp. WAC 01424]